MAKLSALFSAPAGIVKFFREAREELKKVSWPTRETTIRYTMIVIVSSLAIGLLIGGLDYLFVQGIEYLI